MSYTISMNTPDAPLSEVMRVRSIKTQGRFKRIRNPGGPDTGLGEFFLLLEVTALTRDLYIPLSIASGKKPTGFVYQIEGTGQGDISTTTISWNGDGVTQITLGTIVYVKIPAGKTGTFRILIEMKGFMQKSYSILIPRMNYKHNPADARYEKAFPDIRSRVVTFT